MAKQFRMHPARISTVLFFAHELIEHQLHLLPMRRLRDALYLRHVPHRAAAASTLQTALKEQLSRDPGAVSAFVAGLRHYLHQPLRLKRLLQPCVSPEQSASADQTASQSPSEPAAGQRSQAEANPAENHVGRASAPDQPAEFAAADADPGAGKPLANGDSAATAMVADSTLPAVDASATSAAASALQGPESSSDAPCLLSVLTGIAPLRPALVDLLMDTMVAVCQHGRGGDRGSVGGVSVGGAAQPSLASAVATGEHCVLSKALPELAAHHSSLIEQTFGSLPLFRLIHPLGMTSRCEATT